MASALGSPKGKVNTKFAAKSNTWSNLSSFETGQYILLNKDIQVVTGESCKTHGLLDLFINI